MSDSENLHEAAADWYNQRIDPSQDGELKAILTHNMNEEKEHAAMIMEWLRRNDPELDRYMAEYLFGDGDIATRKEAATGAPAGAAEASPPPTQRPKTR